MSHAIHKACQDAIVNRIKGLTLDGIPSTRVYTHLVPDDPNVTLPCVVVSLENEAEVERPIAFELVEVQYPVRVAIVDRASGLSTTLTEKLVTWRHQLLAALRHRTLPAVPEIYTCRLDLDAAITFPQEQYQYFVSGFLVRCYSVEPTN